MRAAGDRDQQADRGQAGVDQVDGRDDADLDDRGDAAAEPLARRRDQKVAAALRDFDFPPELLVLEITETVLMNDTTATITTLDALKDLGVRLAIDDFGTGYSSLTYLQRFPIDILKIDKSFVDGLGGANVEESAVARTIVALAKTLKLETVAEGVERSEHVRELQDLHCDIAQGFFFARPLDSRALEVLLLSANVPMTGADVATTPPAIPVPRMATHAAGDSVAAH